MSSDESSAATESSPAPLGESMIPLVNRLQDIFSQVGSSQRVQELVQACHVIAGDRCALFHAGLNRFEDPPASSCCHRQPEQWEVQRPRGTGAEPSRYIVHGLHALHWIVPYMRPCRWAETSCPEAATS